MQTNGDSPIHIPDMLETPGVTGAGANKFLSVAEDVVLGKNVRLSNFINLYGCSIGDETKVGAFVEIQKNARVGKRCKISSHSFLCEGVTIEDNVFIGHGVTFVNDRYPRATTSDGNLQTEADWKVEPTVIRKGASIGSGATLLSGLEVGENAIVGAGSVVTKNIPSGAIAAGNPAKVLRYLDLSKAESDSLRPDVPFVDLATPHAELERELTDVFRRALLSGAFIGGPMVQDFEESFADLCGTSYCAGVASGTDALRFAIMACGVKSGDAIITVPHTFIATTEAISQAGANPEFVDVDERTYNMSADNLREFLEKQCIREQSGKLLSRRSGRPVTAIIPVHLYGQMADMDRILQLAEEYHLVVIEDACQAHGAQYFSQQYGRWIKAGSMGHAAAFSFYPGKNLGACGEAGAVTTNDLAVANKIKMFRDHGQAKKYHHDAEGYNGRLDAIQAGLLRVKLEYLEEWNSQRRKLASEYNRLLAPIASLILPYEPDWSRAVYHLYVVRTSNRDGLMEHLKRDGINTGIHYPIPLHLQKAYESQNYRESDFPVATRIAAEILSLPMFPQLQPEQQSRVVDSILRFESELRLEPEREAEMAPASKALAPRISLLRA